MSEKYHIARGSEKFGPYTKQQIDEYLGSGNLLQTDLAWTEGQDDWVPLSQLQEDGPPPPPSPDVPPMPGVPGTPPVPGALDAPPMMGAPMGVTPAADTGSSTKNTIKWVVRGVVIFLILGFVIVYFVKEKPMQDARSAAYEKINEREDGINDGITLDELTEKLEGPEPKLDDKKDEDGEIVIDKDNKRPIKIATYTYKGFLLNYKLVVEYTISEGEEEAIEIGNLSMQ